MPEIVVVIALLAALFATTPAAAADKGGRPGVEAQLATLLPKQARWGLVVIDVATGRELAAVGNATAEPLIPGSLIKLFVTGAVLEEAERGGGEAAARLLRELRAMNVHSINRAAQSRFLALGEHRFGKPATPEKGGRAVAEFLAGLGLPAGEVVVVDGSGLAKENRVSARFLARYLREVSKRPWYPRFRETLPRPGLEGTVKDVGATDRRFRVKSGHLDNVFALAGYGIDPAGRELAFAYLVNGRGKITDRAKSRGKVVRLLAGGAFR